MERSSQIERRPDHAPVPETSTPSPGPLHQGRLFWVVTAAAVAILVYQLFIPPIVGIADQNDFRRVIGVFGYGPALSPVPFTFAWVAPRYVPDPTFRARGLEHFTSEYLFTAIALGLNRVLSRDGSLNIEVMGLVHALAFLAAFLRLLHVTGKFRARNLIWIAALLILTDVGYVAYWNTFYMEPASCIFFLFLLAESVDIARRGRADLGGLVRWTVFGTLFIQAKELNAVTGMLLAVFAIAVLRPRTTGAKARAAAAAGFVMLGAVSILRIVTVPHDDQTARAYETVFYGILPESRNPVADLTALGLDPALKEYSGSGPWSLKTAYPELVANGALDRITSLKIVSFYLARPARMWRHIHTLLPISTGLRPECCGNFEPSAGLPPSARSGAFAVWSWIHEHVLVHFAKLIFFALPLACIGAIVRSRSLRSRDSAAADKSTAGIGLEFAALLAASCFLTFLASIFGDAAENVRHLFLFNLMLDTSLVAVAAAGWPAISSHFSRRGAL